MVPKKSDEAMNKYRSFLVSQKISANRNGIPVWPEKNKSPPKENLLIMSVAAKLTCPGKGPR